MRISSSQHLWTSSREVYQSFDFFLCLDEALDIFWNDYVVFKDKCTNKEEAKLWSKNNCGVCLGFLTAHMQPILEVEH